MMTANVQASNSKKILFLDRDGIVNALVIDPEQGTIDSPQHPIQVSLIESTVTALHKLQHAGFEFILISNQPAAAKGKTTRENLEAVQEKILSALKEKGIAIKASYLCFHRSEDHCSCRKPKPGLLLQAMQDHSMYAYQNCWMAGDGITDVQAAQAAGIKAAFIAAKKSDIFSVLEQKAIHPEAWYATFADFADALLTSETTHSS